MFVSVPQTPCTESGFNWVPLGPIHSWLTTVQYETYTYTVKVKDSCAATLELINNYVPNFLATDYNAKVAAGDEHMKSATTQKWQCTEGDSLQDFGNGCTMTSLFQTCPSLCH